jgi:hypothetical protein
MSVSSPRRQVERSLRAGVEAHRPAWMRYAQRGPVSCGVPADSPAPPPRLLRAESEGGKEHVCHRRVHDLLLVPPRPTMSRQWEATRSSATANGSHSAPLPSTATRELTQSRHTRPRRPHLPWPIRVRCRSFPARCIAAAAATVHPWCRRGACAGSHHCARDLSLPWRRVSRAAFLSGQTGLTPRPHHFSPRKRERSCAGRDDTPLSASAGGRPAEVRWQREGHVIVPPL